MTTPTPYDPAPAPPPMPAYSTAPPWAPAATTVVDEGVPSPRHGELLVPYPELMYNAARPTPPRWRPIVTTTVVLTVLGTIATTAVCTIALGPFGGLMFGATGGSLGLFGAVMAGRRARIARQGRNSRYPYWLAFGLTLVAVALPAWLALHGTEQVVQSSVMEPRATTALESSILHGGRIETPSGVTVQSVTCTPYGDRDQVKNTRPYDCAVRLSNNQSGTIRVVADEKGHWNARK